MAVTRYPLPNLLDADLACDFSWQWPYACHRHGHVWVVGKMFCGQCGASYRAHGPDQGEWQQRPWRVLEVVTPVTGFDRAGVSG